MGRDSGYIAVKTGISGGAEAILIPEKKTTINELIAILDRGSKQKKSSSLVVIAEGGESGGVIELAKKVEEKFSYYDTRVTILGHLQRGGTPTCTDRVLASLLGVRAVEGLIEGKTNMMVGTINKKVVFTPFENALKKKKTIDRELLRISKILSNN
jgi:6-phosphofructokinase 1